ncbi:dethiobiotin synthase [Pedobacter metabolipauper]|uniref:ATP-dependent dethiobiotin synthetase BioD n=1 Tax=Pedobacter metabolipauper TaxID=425513 RepID=A0A4R6SXG4_9SPHI|nr:dethiobiotin synthase [Pedobacter metabolipauper]TDQ11096.1 dethiobiotin synthetase [Pedobacter metabolipauper]
MKDKPLFVTGIGTDVGKTICSAVLCEQLKADYWKPVQAGDLGFTDSDRVRKMVRNPLTKIHPEAFRLKLAASPHHSALVEGIEICRESFKLPETDRLLLIEGAGGLFVPLSSSFFMIDLIIQFEAEAVLVVRNYLGCINHTLLSIEALKQKNIVLKYIVLNGNFPEATKAIILEQFPEETTLIEIPEF